MSIQQLDALTRAEDLLRVGDYDRGWPMWEAVRADLSRYVPHAIPRGLKNLVELRRGFPAPRDVIVLQEGGSGDTFMAARYAADLAAEGIRVIWQTPPEMASLLRTVPGMAQVIDKPVSLGKSVGWVRALSLPARYGIPGIARVPYMRAPRDWRLFKKARVGVRTTSGPLTPGGRNRNMPEALAAEMVAQLATRYEVIDLNLPLGTDWSVTARLIRTCVSVVSVDTGVAHLAGALGADLRIVLGERADWRWGEGKTTPWYPTARLFRASRDWDAAVHSAIADL